MSYFNLPPLVQLDIARKLGALRGSLAQREPGLTPGNVARDIAEQPFLAAETPFQLADLFKFATQNPEAITSMAKNTAAQALGTMFGLPEAWDADTRMLKEQYALGLQSPVSTAMALFPTPRIKALRGGDKIPRHVQYWAKVADESRDYDDFRHRVLESELRLQTRAKHAEFVKTTRISPAFVAQEAEIGKLKDFIDNPEIRDMLGEVADEPIYAFKPGPAAKGVNGFMHPRITGIYLNVESFGDIIGEGTTYRGRRSFPLSSLIHEAIHTRRSLKGRPLINEGEYKTRPHEVSAFKGQAALTPFLDPPELRDDATRRQFFDTVRLFAKRPNYEAQQFKIMNKLMKKTREGKTLTDIEVIWLNQNMLNYVTPSELEQLQKQYQRARTIRQAAEQKP